MLEYCYLDSWEQIYSEILLEILYIFIQENAFENVIWKTAAILSRPQCSFYRAHFINVNFKPSMYM